MRNSRYTTGKIARFALYLVFGLLAINGYTYVRASGVTGESRDNTSDNAATFIGDLMVAQATGAPPTYTEINFTSLGGEIFINPRFVGKINAVRTTNRAGVMGERIDVDVRTLTDGWKRFELPPSEQGASGVIISGDAGIIKISTLSSPSSPDAGGITPTGELLIEYGGLVTTFLIPRVSVLEPSKFEVSLLNFNTDSPVLGQVIALKDDQLAAVFANISGEVVNDKGMLRVSLKNPNGSYINSDLPGWGYNIMVSETDTGKPAEIKATVFGLPSEASVVFNFSPLSGQIFEPERVKMSVTDINSGKTVSTITTTIPGAQPLSVTAERAQ